ncbi:MAG: transcriptional regulator, family [Burkholderiaceae bacterium]|nr:transcriptional regulator, family [Burkholderiaceae bacterium]
MNITGSTLRQIRQKIGLSQARLAELSGVSQHAISAFELEKLELPQETLKKLASALADKDKVDSLVSRQKRYVEHKFVAPAKLSNRIERAIRTSENSAYCKCLDVLGIMHAHPKDGALTALSLFSGCGGFSLGFSAAGFKVKGFVELDKNLRSIYKKNFPDSLELGGDITKIDDDALKSFQEKIGDIDVIIGGPPCQGFSLSGKRDVNDPRNTLFKHYLRFVKVYKPKIAVLENVRLLTSMKNSKGEFIKEEICKEFKNHGYKINFFEVNAKNYGVPQHRERVVFIAVRSDIGAIPSIPDVTHGEVSDIFSTVLPCRTFADACSDLEYLESGDRSGDALHEAVKHPAHVLDWLWDVPEGHSAHDNLDPDKRPKSGYNTTYKRQVWLEPASTVQTTFGMISGCRNVHPVATRSLTIREAMRIQSFPDSYRFEGTLGAIRTGIGNAVPPLLAYYLAEHTKHLLGLDFVKIPSL